jgi:hypothetical protein
MRMAASVVAIVTLWVFPARSADGRPDAQVDAGHAQAAAPPAPDPRIWQTAPTPQGPSSQTQRETARARGLSRQLLVNEGTDHPGEDQLGNGTSITH